MFWVFGHCCRHAFMFFGERDFSLTLLRFCIISPKCNISETREFPILNLSVQMRAVASVGRQIDIIFPKFTPFQCTAQHRLSFADVHTPRFLLNFEFGKYKFSLQNAHFYFDAPKTSSTRIEFVVHGSDPFLYALFDDFFASSSSSSYSHSVFVVYSETLCQFRARV